MVMSIDKSQRFVPFQMFCRPEAPQGRESFRSMSCRWSQAGAGHKLTDTVLDVKLWWAQVIQGSRLSALRPHRPLFLLGRRCRCSCSWVKAGLGMIETDKSIWQNWRLATTPQPTCVVNCRDYCRICLFFQKVSSFDSAAFALFRAVRRSTWPFDLFRSQCCQYQ